MTAIRTASVRHFVAILFLFSTASSAFGQDSEALAEARAALAYERQKVVEEDLQLSESEAKQFWPVYTEYRKQMTEVRDRQTELVTGYLQAYASGELSNNYADQLLRNYMAIENDVLKVRQKFVSRYKKILPPLKVARFYQIENKIDAEIDINLANMIPLVDPN